MAQSNTNTSNNSGNTSNNEPKIVCDSVSATYDYFSGKISVQQYEKILDSDKS